MSNYFDVREALGVEPSRPTLFFRRTPDKAEAAIRYAATEQMFQEWHDKINSTNTRQIPADIAELYDEAAIVLCRIMTEEKRILTGGVV